MWHALVTSFLNLVQQVAIRSYLKGGYYANFPFFILLCCHLSLCFLSPKMKEKHFLCSILLSEILCLYELLYLIFMSQQAECTYKCPLSVKPRPIPVKLRHCIIITLPSFLLPRNSHVPTAY